MGGIGISKHLHSVGNLLSHLLQTQDLPTQVAQRTKRPARVSEGTREVLHRRAPSDPDSGASRYGWLRFPLLL